MSQREVIAVHDAEVEAAAHAMFPMLPNGQPAWATMSSDTRNAWRPVIRAGLQAAAEVQSRANPDHPSERAPRR